MPSFPSKFFAALQSYCSCLSVVFLSYNSWSTLIRRDDWEKFGRVTTPRHEMRNINILVDEAARPYFPELFTQIKIPRKKCCAVANVQMKSSFSEAILLQQLDWYLSIESQDPCCQKCLIEDWLQEKHPEIHLLRIVRPKLDLRNS